MLVSTLLSEFAKKTENSVGSVPSQARVFRLWATPIYNIDRWPTGPGEGSVIRYDRAWTNDR